MASFELVSKAGDGSSDSALWLKELDAAIGAEHNWQDPPSGGGAQASQQCRCHRLTIYEEVSWVSQLWQ